MMKLLIVSATFREIEPFVKQFTNQTSENGNLLKINHQNHEIEVLITGIGMVNTAYHLGKIFSNNHYDLVVNAGIAGAFKRNIGLGEVVNVVTDLFSELGAENGEDFIPGHQLNFIAEHSFIKNGIIKNSSITPADLGLVLNEVSGITVNTVHGNELSIKKVVETINPDVETMEGAAFLQVCLLNNIQCIQLRGISNYVERRNPGNWKTELAIKNLCRVLEQLIDTRKVA